MLTKSVLLGSSLAFAMAVGGAAWAGDYDGKDDGYDKYKRVYCPAKSEWKCERKGGEFKSKWWDNYCVFKETDFKKCESWGNYYKAKVEEITLWKYNKKYNKCGSYENETVKACWKKIGWNKWVPVPAKFCQKCLDDEENGDNGGHWGDKDDDHKGGYDKDRDHKDDYSWKDHRKDHDHKDREYSWNHKD